MTLPRKIVVAIAVIGLAVSGLACSNREPNFSKLSRTTREEFRDSWDRAKVQDVRESLERLQRQQETRESIERSLRNTWKPPSLANPNVTPPRTPTQPSYRSPITTPPYRPPVTMPPYRPPAYAP